MRERFRPGRGHAGGIRGYGAAAALAALVLVTVAMPPALATNTSWPEYGQSTVCGDLNASTYDFHGSEWTSTLEAEFVDGFEAWRYDVEKWSGGYLLSTSGQLWHARWEDLGDDTSMAQTVCLPWAHNIEFNTWKLADYQSTPTRLASVSAHEWGHAFGLGHVGYYDAAYPSADPPTMSTCTSSLGRLVLSNDDEAAITAQNEAVSGMKTMTANASFEENESSHLEYWRTQNVASFYASTSGGGVDGSPWWAGFKGNGASNAAVFADTFITAHDGGVFWARANYKKHASTDRGNIVITAKYYLYEHSGTSCGKLPSTTPVSGWYSKSLTRYPSSSWSYSTVQFTGAIGAQLHRVVFGRVVVYNHMEKSIDGSWYPQYVRIDRTRVMWDE